MSKVTRTAGARKSLGEFKPIIITEVDNGRTNADGAPVIKRTTEVLGTSSDGFNADGTVKPGKFGKFRGLTFNVRQEAIDHAARRIEVVEADLAEREARRHPTQEVA